MATDKTLTISGTMTYPVFAGGPNTSVVIGTPNATPTSSSVTLTFEEGGATTYSIAASGTQAISFGSVADADHVYIGTDAEVTVTMNGGTDTFTIGAGGFMIFHLCSCTAASITAGAAPAEVSVMVLGDNA
jgi:hypothetical protein